MKDLLPVFNVIIMLVGGAVCCRIWYKIGLMRGYGVWLGSSAERKTTQRALKTLNRVDPSHEELVKLTWKMIADCKHTYHVRAAEDSSTEVVN